MHFLDFSHTKILSRKGTIDSQILISLRSNDKVNFGGAKFTGSQIHTSVYLGKISIII